MWFSGPDLQTDKYEDNQLFPDPSYRDELNCAVNLSMTECSSNFYDELFNVTNNFIKLIRIFSFIFRFINNIKTKESCNKEKYLTADEIKRSTEFLAKIAQLSEFKAEIDALKKGKGVSKTSKLRALDPFLDENYLLKVGGRLSNADLPFEAKHQIIIPIPLSDNINEYEVLTPGHFIIGRPISAIPEPAILDISENRLSRWQYTTKCVQTLWKRWKNDYLNHLQQRNKWQFEKNNVAVGCLVLLKGNDLPPCKWAMARILEVIYGTDEPQYPSTSTSALLIPPVTPSQNTDKVTEYDSSSDPSNAVMDMNDLKPTPKIARPLKETLAMFRKRAKTPTAPSAAARAAACIVEEHRMKIKYMEMNEERKNEEHQEQLSNNMKMDEERKNEEHKLWMELLRIKIAHAKEKMEAQKILATTLKGSPKIYLQNTE
ncbi:integrase catalytic domain-containing protein [Trichonephila clavipes]|nr:integrase catalytic domain-containing protein [Trichonephila clavipes]